MPPTLITQAKDRIKTLYDEIQVLELLVFRHDRIQKIKAQRASVQSRMKKKSKYKPKLKAALNGVRTTEG